MDAKDAGGNADHVQHAIERLRQHLVDLTARKAGGSQVQIRERQHVALHAPPLFFIHSHHHQHAGEEFGQHHQREQIDAVQNVVPRQENCGKTQQAPCGESDGEEQIHARFLLAPLLPERVTDQEKKNSHGQNDRDVDPAVCVCNRPNESDGSRPSDRAHRNPEPRIEPRRAVKGQGAQDESRLVQYAVQPEPFFVAPEYGHNAGGGMQGKQRPSSRPSKQVFLVFQAV